MGLLETLRRWVDGEDADDALGRAAAEQAKPRRQAEDFIVKIARAIGEVMQAEAVPLPPDQIVIPPEYIVFISDEDDRDWQGIKRRALEQGLHHVLAEHARELAGKTKLGTASFSVELRVDGTLEKGEVRIQHSWEETASATKTSITPRKNAPQIPLPQSPNQPLQNQPDFKATPIQPPQVQPQTANDFEQTFEQNYSPAPKQNNPSDLPPTVFAQKIPLPNANQVDEFATNIERQPEESDSEGSEATQVKKRETFRLEIWRGQNRQTMLPIFKDEITVGRKSKATPSDVQLEGDPEISRPHIVLRRDHAGNFWLTHKGKNPTLVGGREAPSEQPFPVMPDEPIVICSYLLRIQT